MCVYVGRWRLPRLAFREFEISRPSHAAGAKCHDDAQTEVLNIYQVPSRGPFFGRGRSHFRCAKYIHLLAVIHGMQKRS